MKKILFLIPYLNIGGLQRVQVSIANQLAARGYDVTVKILHPENDYRDVIDKRVRVIYVPFKPHLGKKIPYIRHKLYDGGLWETRTSPRRLYRYYVGGEKYDAEVAFFRGVPVKAISGSTNRSAVHIAWVHSDFSKTDTYLRNHKTKAAAEKAYRSFDKIVCVSGQAAEGFKKALGDFGNITTVYNLLPVGEVLEKAKETPPVPMKKARFHLVLAGHLIDKTKGQTRLIDAVCRLRREGADISLRLVGSGKDEALVKNHIKENNADGYITLTDGGINPYPYIKEADLLVCASYFEGYNLTVAEALILGVPVMSTDCAGPNEILDRGEYGLIVENNTEGIFEGLKKLYEDPALLKHYKEKAALRRDFFDEEKITQQIESLFRSE